MFLKICVIFPKKIAEGGGGEVAATTGVRATNSNKYIYMHCTENANRYALHRKCNPQKSKAHISQSYFNIDKKLYGIGKKSLIHSIKMESQRRS